MATIRSLAQSGQRAAPAQDTGAGHAPKAAPRSPFAETVKRLGLSAPQEALLCAPASFADLRYPNRIIPDAEDRDRRLYALTFEGSMRGFDRNKRPVPLQDKARWRDILRLEFDLLDAQHNRVICNVFGNPWPYKDLVPGETMALVGRVKYFGGSEPEAYLGEMEAPPAHAIGRIWVKYLGIPGRVAGEKVEALVRGQIDNPDALRLCAARLAGAIGMEDREALEQAGAQGIESFVQLLTMLHRPMTIEEAWMAKVVAQKLAAMAVQASALRHNLRLAHPESPIPLDPADVEWLASTQPEQLSVDQRTVATTVAARLRSPKPLNGLLSGDVGTGKTLAFLLPAVAAHRAGAKVAIIAPTSILADQIARNLIARFGPHLRGVERIQAGGKIADHSSILVGTPGLTSVATKARYTPNLLICDEQHKFGTEVREKMIRPWTHVLDVTATPVPRSLASAMFGGKEILNLRQCPVEKVFHNEIGDVADRPRFAAMLKWAVANGLRAAVVYPRVKAQTAAGEGGVPAQPSDAEVAKQEAASVIGGAQALERAFPGKVVALHSNLAQHEIAAAIEAVRDGSKPLLVASTLIEIGIDIPSMAVMIVRDADWFGISQLHQLRGRLVRNGGEGHFAMMVADLGELDQDTLSRLEAVKGSTDGFALAEMDLKLRGFGDLDGTAQSGSTNTVFRLIQLRPEDFLRKKLSVMDVLPAGVPTTEQQEESAQVMAEQLARTAPSMQPRLFA